VSLAGEILVNLETENLNTLEKSCLLTLRGRNSEPVGNLLSHDPEICEPETGNTLKYRNYHPEIVLCHPQIPPNTGTIVRLAAAVCCRVHIIEPTGFELSEKSLRRAGLDYWEHAEVFCHSSWNAFLKVREKSKRRFIFVETGGNVSPHEFKFLPGDLLVFGAETFGVPKDIMNLHLSQKSEAHLITLPMYHEKVRSLNLSNTVSVVTYAAVASLRHKS
jgi:tRNA (cytidine/uridine-2'-O-)-methyltransferase